MTRYRYNAILHLGHETEFFCDDVFYDWEEYKWTLDQIRSMLLQHPTKRIGIKCIQNARIEKDLAALAVLRDTEVIDTAGKLRHRLGQYVGQGVHPQALMDLETEILGFAVFLSWAACRPNGSFDAFFVPKVSLNSISMLTIGWPKLEASALVRLTNAPGQHKLRDELTSQLIAHCRRNLPGDTLRLEVALVDVVPHRSHGDIDPLALLSNTRNATL
jgi:hypothetical protein